AANRKLLVVIRRTRGVGVTHDSDVGLTAGACRGDHIIQHLELLGLEGPGVEVEIDRVVGCGSCLYRRGGRGGNRRGGRGGCRRPGPVPGGRGWWPGPDRQRLPVPARCPNWQDRPWW